MKKQPYKKISVVIFFLFIFTLFSHSGSVFGGTPAGNVLGQFATNVFPPRPPSLVFLPILLFNIPDDDVVCRCWSAEDVAEWVGIVDAQSVGAKCDIYDEDGSS